MNLHSLQSRLIAVRQDVDAIGTAFGLVGNPILRWRGQEVWLPADFREQLKAKVLEVLAIIDAAGDKAVALGGEVDKTKQIETMLDPINALKILNGTIDELLALPKIQPVVEDSEGNYSTSLSADIEADVISRVSTVGAALKLWVTWAKPQVEAL